MRAAYDIHPLKIMSEACAVILNLRRASGWGRTESLDVKINKVQTKLSRRLGEDIPLWAAVDTVSTASSQLA